MSLSNDALLKAIQAEAKATREAIVAVGEGIRKELRDGFVLVAAAAGSADEIVMEEGAAIAARMKDTQANG